MNSRSHVSVARFWLSILFVFTNLLSPSIVNADVLPESYPGSCTLGINDTGCWQAAINAASPNAPQFGTVAAVAGKVYYIKDTLVVCNAVDGTIDGHGAILRWSGPANVPILKFSILTTHDLLI